MAARSPGRTSCMVSYVRSNLLGSPPVGGALRARSGDGSGLGGYSFPPPQSPALESGFSFSLIWAPAASRRRALVLRTEPSRVARVDPFSSSIPAVKRKRQPHTSVAGGRADEESASAFNALDYRS